MSDLARALDTAYDLEEDLSAPRFVMDFSMFRVAKQLRLLGYDVICDKRLRGAQILEVAVQQRRILVSGSKVLGPQAQRYNRETQKELDRRRQGISKKRVVVAYNSDGESEYETSSEENDSSMVRVVEVRATDPHEKTLKQILETLSLKWNPRRIFSRCVTCNRLIKPIDRLEVEALVHPTVFRVYKTFYRCPECHRVFWGVDNGIIVNFKAMRTIEHLRRFGAPSSESPCSQLRRHFLSYPRAVKCLIFDFLTPEELNAFEMAFPMLSELVGIVRRGESRRFVPQWRMAEKNPQKQ